MKTVIILLCAVLIGFGYLLSEDLQAQSVITRLQQQVSQLESANRALQTQVDAILTELARARQANSELTQQNQAQTETIRQLNLTIANQQKQIVALQAEINFIQAGASIRGLASNALRSGIFLPVIPAALATTYLIARSHKHAARKSKTTTGPRSTGVQLTDREVQTLIRLRRKQYQ